MTDLIPTVSLTRLLDPAQFRAAAELRANYRCREAVDAAKILAGFIEEFPELLMLIASESLTPERSLRELRSAVTNAGKAIRHATDQVRAERRAFKERNREAICVAIQRHGRTRDELAALETRIANIGNEREAARERLKAAGLDAAQIGKLELPPTQREVDKMHQQAHQLRATAEVLMRFVNDPRREVLGGVDLAGFPVGTLPHERDAAAKAAEEQQDKRWINR